MVSIVIDRLRRWVGFLLLTNKSFRAFRWFGVHLTPVHFYSPVPDIRELDQRPAIWREPSRLPGIDMNFEEQRSLMQEVFVRYSHECDFPATPTAISHAYYTQNGYFGYVSAVAMHCIVRHHRPKRVIEIGAGFSTRVLANAALHNGSEGDSVELTAIDPYPSDVVQRGFPGLTRLIKRPVQDVDLALFATLSEADILSIDSSHVVRIGSDVNYLYLEVLPRLAPGVIVHVHDIFLPYDYPRKWLERRYFWNEQYLLQALLIQDSAYRVLWGQRYSEAILPDIYAKTFCNRLNSEDNFDSYSFWMKRIV